MKFLLDTHMLLFWLDDDERLGSKARQLIADPANDIFVSLVALFEIVVKIRIGKLAADIAEILDATGREGFLPLAIESSHLLTLARLPAHHRDPFDHLLIAQAITEKATFISADRNGLKCPLDLLTCAGRMRPRSTTMQRQFFVYILTNRRLAQHRAKTFPGFTTRYNLDKLVFYEAAPDPRSAIARE